jgi:hypothetical protein
MPFSTLLPRAKLSGYEGKSSLPYSKKLRGRVKWASYNIYNLKRSFFHLLLDHIRYIKFQVEDDLVKFQMQCSYGASRQICPGAGHRDQKLEEWPWPPSRPAQLWLRAGR